jgi:hypothetical protein
MLILQCQKDHSNEVYIIMWQVGGFLRVLRQ